MDSAAPAQDMVFDKIMEIVGDDGPFQKRFNYIFNIGLVFCASMVYLNIILALNVPDHNCYVPGRNETNFTIDEWKEITLPRENNTNGVNHLSNCKMYNMSVIKSSVHDKYKPLSDGDDTIIDCIYGYEYDKQWYECTVVSQEDWVCEKDLYQTNIFVFNRIGEVIGTFIFGQLGDTLGRRLIYYISIIILIAGRICILIFSSKYVLLSTAVILGSLTAISIFQTPLIIAMEMSKSDDRATIAMFQSLGWTAGLCALPFIFWLVRDWNYFILITTLPLAIFFFFPKYMIESPRWLASRGRFKLAAKQLQIIADINGKTDVKIDEKYLKNILPNFEVEKVYGIASLFSGWRLAKNTTLLVMCWIICTLGYFTLIIHISQMSGNPFLNFFWQSIIEGPAYVLGQYAGNRIGRRYTNLIAFAVAACACLPTIYIVSHNDWSEYLTYFTVIIKFWTTIVFFAINLQAMETYPTCLRQTGLATANVVANALGVIGPYIVYLGTNYDARYPYIILFVLYLIGTICALFLPETLHQKLPDSLEEAKSFGANQDFWSIPKPRNVQMMEKEKKLYEMKLNNNEELEMLNQQKFSP